MYYSFYCYFLVVEDAKKKESRHYTCQNPVSFLDLFILFTSAKVRNKKSFYYFCSMNLDIFKQFTITALFVVAACLPSYGQQPVSFTVQQKQLSPHQLEVIFTGKIADGWHVYSTGLPAGGPTSATLHVEQAKGAKLEGGLRAQGKEINAFDRTFGMQLRYFEHQVVFTQRFQLTGPSAKVKGYLEYGTCNDQMCMPPQTVEFEAVGAGAEPSKKDKSKEESKDESKEESKNKTSSDNPQEVVAVVENAVSSDSLLSDSASSQTPDSLFSATSFPSLPTGQNESEASGAWSLFLMGFLGGLLALFTPCVWPVIPMTVSFFLKRSKDKRKGIRDAFIYGFSIVAIFLLLGSVVTAFARPEALNALATNAWFNLFFFAMLIVFALSLFGWFELSLPSRWADGVDKKADELTSNTSASSTRPSTLSGLLSIFLMAFTLVLISFSCTAPIVGLLLVEAVTTGSRIGPLLGMTGFALALALPFTLFALFPSWLKQAPKSGAWMNTLKVTLGFLELAFALKFFSVADLAYGWGLLSRDVFFALWIAIFLMLGLYLIGVYRFQSDGDRKAQPVPCILLGLCSIAFSFYMVPGLWGAPCKAVSAFAPPIYTQQFNMNKNEVRAAFTDYEAGMQAARVQGKPVLIDFTGYGCVNCRKMEAAVWTDPRVAERLTRDFVLISLYVDDKQPLPEPLKVKGADGKEKTLRTVGDKWSHLQQTKFGYLAQPFYVAVDADGNLLTTPYAYNEDVDAYLQFLDGALKR